MPVCVLITSSSLTLETQPTLLWDQLAATSFLGFDKLYVTTIHSESFTFGDRCGSLIPMCICVCDAQKISPNEFHLARCWASWTCFDHNARPNVPHRGKIMYSFLLYFCSTTQCASPCKTTCVKHEWKVNSMMFILNRPFDYCFSISPSETHVSAVFQSTPVALLQLV